MRTDDEVESQLASSGMTESRWGGGARDRWMRSGGGEISLSISGYEPNRLFLSARGRQFRDISGVSGLDGLEDGRAFALFDYNRDGWQDVAVVNINAPFLNLYRNDIGVQNTPAAPGMIALRFVGGNDTSIASASHGPRDGYGARVTVSVGGDSLLREHRCGEGLAVQNSATMLVGIGDNPEADEVVVSWPGGTVQRVRSVTAGALITFFENPDDSPGGVGYQLEEYFRGSMGVASTAVSARPAKRVPFTTHGSADPAVVPQQLQMFTSTATWCAACKASLPQLRLLRDSFTARELAMSGVPVDPLDSRKKLDHYLAKYRPAYDLRTDLGPDDLAAFSRLIAEATGIDALPSTLVTDSRGDLLLALSGVPTVSQVRRLLLSRTSPKRADHPE